MSIFNNKQQPYKSPRNGSEVDQIKAIVFDKKTQNIMFNYSLIDENTIERKKTLKFFISTLLECNVMVNETIEYHSPDKIKSILHYIKSDKETRISPVGVYSSIGQVDYFAFQRTTKTFKVDFYDELTNDMKTAIYPVKTLERGTFRTFKTLNRKHESFMKMENNTNEELDTNNSFNNDNKNNNLKSNDDNISHISVENVNYIGKRNDRLKYKQKKSLAYGSSYKVKIGKYNNSTNDSVIETVEVTNSSNLSSSISWSNSSFAKQKEKFVDFSLEYIYDAKHLIHSVSDFRSTPHFNNISYNYDVFTWHLSNENNDKSDEKLKIELFFDMEENFYNENIFMNLNFTKTILLLDQGKRNKLENAYITIDSRIILENSTYWYSEGSIYLMEKIMNSSPDLEKLQYYVNNKNSKPKSDLVKIMKIEAQKLLKYNETFLLEVKFPLYFENCRNYKTNTMIMLTGIILMIFLGSIFYLIISLNFSDKN